MVGVRPPFCVLEERNTRISNPMEKATAYLCRLNADRMAAMQLSKEKELEAMLIKAREEGFSKHGRKDLEKLWK